MNNILNFDDDNTLKLTKEEVLSFIDQEDKITVILGNGFKAKTDTEDVFRGIMGDERFEESEEISGAIHCASEIRHTFFLVNSKVESPFNERGNAKRIIREGFWTKIILPNHPLKNGLYAVVYQTQSREKERF